MNIKFRNYFFISLGLLALIVSIIAFDKQAYSAPIVSEPVQACVIARDIPLTDAVRSKVAQCLGWQANPTFPICLGRYQPIYISKPTDAEEVHILADTVSFYQNKPSRLQGNVEVQQGQRIVNAQTAYVYRDARTKEITKIDFMGEVHYLEPDKLMIARSASINPQDKSGETHDVLYRFNVNRKNALLPAWGRASLIKRFANKDYLLRLATYTTCSPQDKTWDIEADSIALDDAKARGVARNARLRIKNVPIFYTPYLSFPTNNDRKSGFLTPLVGYSNVNGFDFGLPYYLNLAPNQDLTITPHIYTERGVMIGGEYRYLTPKSFGMLGGDFLPNDKAYAKFIDNNQDKFPQLRGNSTNRWTVGYVDTTNFSPDLHLNVNVKQVSDDYYLQDFSTNLAIATQRQLLRQADLVYTTNHWVFRGMAQSYQTLHPINDSPIADIYERLPELMAQGSYYDLPFNGQLNVLGQYDQFYWPGNNEWLQPLLYRPQGPRLHLNPILSLPQLKPWGYITPSIEIVDNYYQVENNNGTPNASYSENIPRYYLDSGLYFERNLQMFGSSFTQTLEPRLFYLYVPYKNQTQIPVYDSAYMIFNIGQIFRTNRFSGFDRIGDANQLTYALTSRWLVDSTGGQRAVLSVGQIRYFSERQVMLCQNQSGYCVDDPLAFGFLSPTAKNSPIVAYGALNLSPVWSISSDYVWNPATGSTNNSDFNIHYQPLPNQIFSFGYSYLENGDITSLSTNGSVNNSLNQAMVSFATPLSDKWSSFGAYSHNISKNYAMMSLLGFQYDSCCWAVRVLGGRTFKNLNDKFEAQYNNNIYFQVILKGLGSVANRDPGSVLATYIPGYVDLFK